MAVSIINLFINVSLKQGAPSIDTSYIGNILCVVKGATTNLEIKTLTQKTDIAELSVLNAHFDAGGSSISYVISSNADVKDLDLINKYHTLLFIGYSKDELKARVEPSVNNFRGVIGLHMPDYTEKQGSLERTCIMLDDTGYSLIYLFTLFLSTSTVSLKPLIYYNFGANPNLFIGASNEGEVKNAIANGYTLIVQNADSGNTPSLVNFLINNKEPELTYWKELVIVGIQNGLMQKFKDGLPVNSSGLAKVQLVVGSIFNSLLTQFGLDNIQNPSISATISTNTQGKPEFKVLVEFEVADKLRTSTIEI